MGVRKRRLTRGDRNVSWIESHCRIPEGKFVGQPVALRPWQQKIIKGIYDTPTRRAIISFGRKNAKTTLSCFLLLLNLCGPEAKANSQLYSAAQSREQAAILFALAAKVVRMSPDLSSVITVRDTAKQLFCEELGTLYRALSAEASTAYGLSPVFTVHDELGQVKGPRSELYDALETASGAQEEPLSIIISTQAPTDADLLSILIDDAKTGQDEKVKLWLYTADESLDPFGDKAIKQANPAFGDFLNPVEVREQAESARRMPSRESNYRNLILNQRISQVSPFIPRAIWNACSGEIDEEVFRSNTVYMGLDLSARNDLTALAMVAKDNLGVWHCKLEFFAPLANVRDRGMRDRVPYDLWADEGLITLTPGASVDYEYVARRLCELTDDYSVGAIAYDRWRIDVLQAELRRLERELPLVEFGQGFKDMSPALDTLEGELLNHRLLHGGNSVLTWCAANAMTTRDPSGNRKLDKSKATGRIDGMVALAMALGVINKNIAEGPSVYEERGVLTL
ncbi:Terminase large subunit, Lambdalikevirus-type [uncultured Caudovirales phage]|uniref:Terminase large subunit, Lambdalikevirus-type n=1 Tax=uncultured Caudovirales phage TaxID=2100421 RepID=A0A6J5KJF5_9CAUD|nr:Terminase large subunit, Lambdalikevirus-type [uncultured Caudovirales phage]